MRKSNIYAPNTSTRRLFIISKFERPIRKIVYCYGQWQDCFKELVKEVTFMEGIPDDIPALFPEICPEMHTTTKIAKKR